MAIQIKLVDKADNLNLEKFKEAMLEGRSLSECAKAAGSKAKTRSALSGVGSLILKRNPQLKTDIVVDMDSKRKLLIEAITPDKLRKATVGHIAMAINVLTEKIELLKGKPTERIAGDIDFNKKTKEEIAQWLRQRLIQK